MHPPAIPDSFVVFEDASSLALDAPVTAIVMATSVLASAAATATSTLTSAASTSSSQAGTYDEKPGECELLGPFAILVQGALGALALLSLVFKRWRERPQRPLKIWFFDVSKQVVGSILVHIANIFMSMLTSGRFSVQVEPVTSKLVARSDDDDYAPNPCSSYLLNLAIDTTLGIPILILLLRIFTGLARLTPLGKPSESVQSGNYGSPPRVVWWLKQSFIYFCGLFGMKVCVLIIFLMLPWISKIGDWALGWTEGNEKVQIAFVMMIFPLIMNALQYYIIDSLIMMKETDDSHSGDQRDGNSRRYDDHEDDTSRARLVNGDHDSDSESDQETVKQPASRPQSKDSVVYDPEFDGDDQTVVASSAGARHEQGKAVSPELYPKE